jgi:hypothetical protein
MPTPVNGLWDSHFHGYEQVSAQITRWFRHFSVYVGGENLTGFRQKQPIINAADPWSSSFDPHDGVGPRSWSYVLCWYPREYWKIVKDKH